MNGWETNALDIGSVKSFAVSGGVAIFDFDRTLIHSGSLAPILAALVGRPRMCAAYARAGLRATFAPQRRRAEIFRNTVLRLTAGRTEAELVAAADRAFRGMRWRDSMLEAYLRHREAGHRVTVASGGLSCCVRRLLELKGITVDGLLATEMESIDGVLTGRIAGSACVGAEKARRARDWLAGAAEAVWGYGNLPADRAMLALVNFPTAVSAFGTRTAR